MPQVPEGMQWALRATSGETYAVLGYYATREEAEGALSLLLGVCKREMQFEIVQLMMGRGGRQ